MIIALKTDDMRAYRSVQLCSIVIRVADLGSLVKVCSRSGLLQSQSGRRAGFPAD